MQVELEVRRDGESPRRLTLGPGVTHLGRAPDNDVVLPDVGVSRRHARIVVRPGAAVIEDLGSGNGTFVRGERIARHTVRDGDQVVIDPFVLILRVGSGAAGRASGEEDETALVDQAQLAQQLSAPQRRARLVALSGHGLAGSYPLTQDGLTLGRSEDRDIVLQDPAASRMQAEIRPTDDVFWLRDFGSANGTFVNGRRVRERPLQHGDRVRVGSTEFRFELQDVAGPAPAPVPAPPPTAPSRPAVPAPVAAPTQPLVVPAPPPTPVVASLSPAAMLPDQPTVAPSARPPGGGLARVLVGVVVAGFVLVVGLGAMAGVIWWQLAGPGATRDEAVDQVAVADPPAADPPAADAPAADAPAADPPAADPPAADAPAAEPAAGDAPAADPAAGDASASVAAGASGESDDLMARGMGLFREGAYLEATAVFYRALKDDPANVEAERMCYVSCEFLAIQQLREDVRQRQVSPEQREALYTEAVRQGRRAVRGRGDLDAAEQAIIAALEWYPQDATLAELQQGIQAQRARAGTASASRSATATPASSGPSAADRRLARQYLDEGLQAIDDGRFVVARDRLARAIALDSSLSSARTNLADVNRVLEDRARSAWSQGQALEAAGNRSAAVAAYEQVVTYASSSQSSLKSQAEARLAALR